MTENNRSAGAPITETATEARQGSYGKPVLLVLVGSLVLAMIAWSAVEFWAEVVDKDPQTTASTTPDPINAPPHGAGTFANNPTKQ